VGGPASLYFGTYCVSLEHRPWYRRSVAPKEKAMALTLILLTALVLSVLSGWSWESPLSQLPLDIQNNLLNPDFTLTLDFTKRAVVAGALVTMMLVTIISRLAQWWRRRQLPDFLRDL
jgi:magnesium-transporting ATPase (P-type)